jgi:hypothetical protein
LPERACSLSASSLVATNRSKHHWLALDFVSTQSIFGPTESDQLHRLVRLCGHHFCPSSWRRIFIHHQYCTSLSLPLCILFTETRLDILPLLGQQCYDRFRHHLPTLSPLSIMATSLPLVIIGRSVLRDRERLPGCRSFHPSSSGQGTIRKSPVLGACRCRVVGVRPGYTILADVGQLFTMAGKLHPGEAANTGRRWCAVRVRESEERAHIIRVANKALNTCMYTLAKLEIHHML